VLTVLIADDEPTIVELVRLTLEDNRIRVIAAHDGATALDLASQFTPDLILLDVAMPELDGLEVCRRLRRDPGSSRTTIVMLTAAAQSDDIARGLDAGANEYLTKPFSPLRLLSLLEDLMPTGALWLPRK
jgi:DNA-binding response OmpR family regulator